MPTHSTRYSNRQKEKEIAGEKAGEKAEVAARTGSRESQTLTLSQTQQKGRKGGETRDLLGCGKKNKSWEGGREEDKRRKGVKW